MRKRNKGIVIGINGKKLVTKEALFKKVEKMIPDDLDLDKAKKVYEKLKELEKGSGLNPLPNRKDVDEDFTWDLTAIFPTEEAYQLTIQEAEAITYEIEKNYKNRLNTADTINECLDQVKKVKELSSLIAAYPRLALYTDQTNSENQARAMKMMNKLSSLESRLTFVKSEIIENDEEVIIEAIQKSKENSLYLREIVDFKKHSLHPETEKHLAALTDTMTAPYRIYNAAILADLDFGNFSVEGMEFPLSITLFETQWESETNTKIRRSAFDAFSSKLKEYQHTVAATYQTQVQKEKNLATLRGFDSVIDSLLYNQKVDRELFDRQIDLTMEKLVPHMQKYAKHLGKIHNLDEMTFADLKLNIDPAYEPAVTVEESKGYIQDALGVLGEDYLEIIKRSYDERWIDFPQSKGKTTGAFCSTPYGCHPYILINWNNKMRDVLILAHELGHAGHFHLTHENQNIFNINPSTYFVEAPSTMNEILLANHLMGTSDEPRFKRWVLSSMVSRTYYHNFVTHLLEAAYQREVYRVIDAGGSVQAAKLNEIKRGVLKKFWGDAVKIVDGAELTWMRQMHYYMGLYPYTYSAGLTIASEVSKRIINEGQTAIEDWKAVLMAGGTKSPVELAKMAGVDITTEEPLLKTIESIGIMIDEIITLTDQIDNK